MSVGRHTHRRERGHMLTPDFTPSGLRLGHCRLRRRQCRFNPADRPPRV